MLSGQILNSDATTNNFIVTDSKEFIPGEQFTLVIRVVNPELDDLRFVQPSASLPKITLTTLDGTDIVILSGAITVNPDDRSIMTTIIQESVSLNLAGGNFQFELDVIGDGSEILKGIVENGLARIDGDC